MAIGKPTFTITYTFLLKARGVYMIIRLYFIYYFMNVQ